LDEEQDGGLSAALASSRERAGLAQALERRKELDGVSEESRANRHDLVRLERQLVNYQADFMDVLKRLSDVEVAVRSLRAELQAERDRTGTS
jgi:predicted  nucleic acid-binding Zn-ribbon protein